MCGATAAQTTLQDEQMDFYQTMTDNYKTAFAEDQGILNAVTASMAPIIAAGVNQEGFSGAEKTTLDTQADEGVATNYAQAKTALQQSLAATGGTSSAEMSSGPAAQLQEELVSSAAGQRSTEQSQITQADYDTGRSNYFNAVQEEENAAGLLNPAGYSGAATNAGSAAGTTANQIASENDSVFSSVMGALGGVASKAAGNINYSGSSGWSYGGF